MKFTILQQDLLPALQTVARSIGVRSTLPVLDNMLLSVEGRQLTIAATNLEIGVIKKLTIEEGEPGEVTVPAKPLVDIISGLKQTQVTLESSEAVVTISAGKFKAQLNGIPATEFPVIPVSSNEGVSFSRKMLASCNQILFAAAVDEGRPALTGIFMQASNGVLDLVATDGFRLAHRHVTLENKDISFKSLIPKRTFEEIIRILNESVNPDSDTVAISTTENQNQAIFRIDNTLISSRLIEEKFPAWEKIIPTQRVSKVSVGKDELLKAIKLAAVFARNEANIAVLQLSPGRISIESSTKELGSQKSELEAEVEGEEIKIAFNVRFLQEAVSNAPSTQIDILFSGALSPALVKPVNDQEVQYIVMPVRLN